MHSMISFYEGNLHISRETGLEGCDQGVTAELPGKWEHNTFMFACPYFSFPTVHINCIRLCCNKKEITDPSPGLRGILVWQRFLRKIPEGLGGQKVNMNGNCGLPRKRQPHLEPPAFVSDAGVGAVLGGLLTQALCVITRKTESHN